MEKIVLDSNSLLRSFKKTSVYHHIWDKIQDGTICLCVTLDILCEYEEKVSYFSTPEIGISVRQQIENAPGTIFINDYMRWNMIYSDPDDNKFVDCAIAANARCIVTNDSDYNVLKYGRNIWPTVDVRTLEEYHKEWKNKTSLSGTSHRKTARPRPRKKK